MSSPVVKYTFKSYFLWVLLPTFSLVLGANHLAKERALVLAGDSVTRLGSVGVLLLGEEMGARSGEMAEAAPLVPNPDPTSPIIAVVSRGDTVAALGLGEGELVLTVALAEAEPGDASQDPEPPGGTPLEIRLLTLPFRPQSLDLFHERTGLGVALYLRGRRAIASPTDFGPSELGLSGSEDLLIDELGFGAILPLAPSRESASAALLLVGPPGDGSPEPLSPGGLYSVLLPPLLGLLIWAFFRSRKGKSPGRPGRLRLLALVAIPLAVSWILALGYGGEISNLEEARLEGDMIRVLALLTADGADPDLTDLSQRTEFEAIHQEPGRPLVSTLPPGPILDAAGEIPPPSPDFPSMGTLGEGRDQWVFATAQDRPNSTFTLLAPNPDGGVRTFLLLTILGGVVSLMALGFLLLPQRM